MSSTRPRTQPQEAPQRKINSLRAIRERELVREICNAPAKDATMNPNLAASAMNNWNKNSKQSTTMMTAAGARQLSDQLRDDPAGHFAQAAASLQRARTFPLQQQQPPVNLVPSLPYFVPSLGELCAQALANNFADIRGIDAISDRQQYDLIIDQVPTDLPLEVAVPRISSESYWKSCCEARFSLGQLPDVTKTDCITPPAKGGWRRVYLERDLEEFMMGLKINFTGKDEEALQQKLALYGQHIYSLKLFRQRAHFDVADLFAKIPRLESFSVSYGVLNAKDAASPDMIGMKQQDALMFQSVLRTSQSLTSLALRECSMDDALGLAICSGLVKNKVLSHLDLSHNRLGDDTAHAVALLLFNGESLKEIRLTNNNIRDRGATSLSEALAVNNSLRLLDLRLNRIEDAGGEALMSALATNSSLLSLDVSANHLGPDAARAARDSLPSNRTLAVLNLSSNAFGEEGGRSLAHGVQHSSAALQDVEVRESGLAPQEMDLIFDVCYQKKEASDRAVRDAADEAQRQEIKKIVADKIRKSHGVL